MDRSVFSLGTPEAIERIRARQPTLGAFISTRLEEAYRDHERRQREIPRSALHGLPYGLKDQWETVCLPTTGGSARFRDRRALVNSPVYEAFEEAGAILLGKTNLSDLGLSPEAHSYVGGPVRNPRDLNRTAGGSSGGAAAAVADGMLAFDWGTDIGGSIRLPAAFCGIYGMRLSSESWPIRGMFPDSPASLAWMLGQGPLTKTIAEMRAVLSVAEKRLRTGPAPDFEIKGAVLYPPHRPGAWKSFVEDVTPAFRTRFGTRFLASNDLPSTREIQKVYAALWSSHLGDLLELDPSMSLFGGFSAVVSSLLFRGRLGDKRFHPRTAEVLALILIGRMTLYRDRSLAIQRSDAMRARFHAAWQQGHVIVAPVTSYPPPLLGRSHWNFDLLSSTIPGNLSDATALAMPFGHFDGLPRSLQLMGPAGSEYALLELAEQLIELGIH